MKKYRVLKEFPFYKVGDILELVYMRISDSKGYKEVVDTPMMVREGWLEEVKEEKKLWEKLYERDQLLIAEDIKECKEVA